MSANKVLLLLGPTASGKTNFAIKLAQKMPVSIISVDSVMIYRGLNIGSGKPSAKLLMNYPHKLVDICEPNNFYSVADFCKDAIAAIEHAHQTGKIPLLVGGTMMYFNALFNGLSKAPSRSESIREQITQEANLIGWPKLHDKLSAKDPVAAAKISPNDPQRIQRALEVISLTGRPFSQQSNDMQHTLNKYSCYGYVLLPERCDLHRRIAVRFDEMLNQGLEAEVANLLDKQMVNKELPAMRSVGYRQMLAFLLGEYNHQQMRYKAIVATRQLAKRQFTWLRRWKTLKQINDLTTILAEHSK